jgi:hypothetical protein
MVNGFLISTGSPQGVPVFFMLYLFVTLLLQYIKQ